MAQHPTRREFLASGSAAALAAWLAPRAAGTSTRPAARNYRKSLKIGMVEGDGSLRDKFLLLKELGFDGVELDSPNGLDPDEVLRAKEDSGLLVPGVVDSVHWRDTLSHPDPEVRARGRAGLETALRDCKTYGGSTVLLVPAVVSGEVSYADAWDRSREEIARVLPLAGELGVRIALENVWNNFLLSPLEAARYVDSFEDPNLGWYLDVGNIVLYGWPAQWARILGHRVFKVDIKDYSRRKCDQEGRWKGFQVKLGEGDADWPAVMAALDEQGYFQQEGGGWGSAEVGGGPRERLQEIAERMDWLFAA